MGWNYAFNWLIVLPFELTAAGITIAFWTNNEAPYNVGIWITVFLVLVTVINICGVKGYGEVEFALGLMKVFACIGFIILGVIIDCGGVPTDTRYVQSSRCQNFSRLTNVTEAILVQSTGMIRVRSATASRDSALYSLLLPSHLVERSLLASQLPKQTTQGRPSPRQLSKFSGELHFSMSSRSSSLVLLFPPTTRTSLEPPAQTPSSPPLCFLSGLQASRCFPPSSMQSSHSPSFP